MAGPRAPKPSKGLYVKYTFDFVDKIKVIHIMPYDMLILFDVEALFPSIPMDKVLELLKKWLEKQHSNPDVLTQNLELTKLVIKLNFVPVQRKVL
jgi:hypothetical protein